MSSRFDTRLITSPLLSKVIRDIFSPIFSRDIRRQSHACLIDYASQPDTSGFQYLGFFHYLSADSCRFIVTPSPPLMPDFISLSSVDEVPHCAVMISLSYAGLAELYYAGCRALLSQPMLCTYAESHTFRCYDAESHF